MKEVQKHFIVGFTPTELSLIFMIVEGKIEELEEIIIFNDSPNVARYIEESCTDFNGVTDVYNLLHSIKLKIEQSNIPIN